MRELEIPRSKLILARLTPQADGAGCLMSHVLRACGQRRPRYESRREPPGVEFYEQRSGAMWELSDAAFSIIHAFDRGRWRSALRQLRDYGWAVTILEDR